MATTTSITATERTEHHARRSQSASALALAITPLRLVPASISISSPDSSDSDSDRRPVRSPSCSHPVTPPPPPRQRPRAHSGPNTPHSSLRFRHTRPHGRSNSTGYLTPFMSTTPRAHFSLPPQNDASGSGQATSRSRSPGPPGSPPPYSPTPPETDPSSPFLFRRAASSPHLHSPPQSPALQYYQHSSSSSRIPSSAMHTRRTRLAYANADTSDDPDTDADASMSEDTVIYTSSQPTLTGTLRARLLGKGNGRADDIRTRPISTAPGVIGAGETETEGEEPVSFVIRHSTLYPQLVAFEFCAKFRPVRCNDLNVD